MKSILLIMLSVATGVCTAQEKKFSIGVQLNTTEEIEGLEFPIDYSFSTMPWEDMQHISLSLGAKYYLKNKTAIRVLAGFTKTKANTDTYLPPDNPDYFHYVISLDQTDLNFAVGIERKIVFEKLVITGGFQVPFNLYGESKLDSYSDETDDGIFQGSLRKISHQDMGYSVGIGGLLGIQYPISSRVYVYAEYSFSWMYLSLGGDGSGETYANGVLDAGKSKTWNQVYTRTGKLFSIGSVGVAYSF